MAKAKEYKKTLVSSFFLLFYTNLHEISNTLIIYEPDELRYSNCLILTQTKRSCWKVRKWI
jgi:hypothetical protein